MAIGVCDTTLNEHLWMASIDTFFYEYCLGVSLYCRVCSCQMNGLFRALPDEGGTELSRCTLVEQRTDTFLTVQRSQ